MARSPRRDATPEQLKRLGAAVEAWWDQEWADADPLTHWIDRPALDDLHAGELPQPFALRLLADADGATRQRLTARQVREALQRARDIAPRLGRLIPEADSRGVGFGLAPRSRADRRWLVEG